MPDDRESGDLATDLSNHRQSALGLNHYLLQSADEIVSSTPVRRGVALPFERHNGIEVALGHRAD